MATDAGSGTTDASDIGGATNASNECCATNAVTSATNADGGAMNAEMGATNAGVQQMRWGATNATGCNKCNNTPNTLREQWMLN